MSRAHRVTVGLGLAGAIGLAGCGSAPDADDDGRVYFSESSSHAYEIGSSDAHFDQLDERVSFGSIMDLLATPTGYFVADGLDPRIVLFDRNLDPVRIMGRRGEGPGEFRFPSRLVLADDRILVLDGGNARVAYLTLEGDFVTSKQFRGNANDVALHPELGLLVAGDAFPDHYLSRLTPTGETAFGPIPPEGDAGSRAEGTTRDDRSIRRAYPGSRRTDRVDPEALPGRASVRPPHIGEFERFGYKGSRSGPGAP